ncbi:MAG: sulfate transporter CysZ [Pseudomonadota bacterium]
MGDQLGRTRIGNVKNMGLENNPVTGAVYLVRGAGLIQKPGIRAFAFAPLLINIIFFVVLWFVGLNALEAIEARIASLPTWLNWLRWLVIPIYYLTTALILFFTFAIFANLFAAPFNGLLAEAVERHLTGEPAKPFLWRDVVADLGNSLRSEVQKLAYFAPRAIGLLILFLIPGVNVVAPFLWALFGAWMLAIGYLDYPMANHGHTFAAQRTRARTRRWLTLGFGGAVMAALLVPIVNLVVVPSAVAGATAFWVDRLKARGELGS